MTVTPSLAQFETGALTAAFPDQLQLGLQQSQYRVVIPAVPVVVAGDDGEGEGEGEGDGEGDGEGLVDEPLHCNWVAYDEADGRQPAQYWLSAVVPPQTNPEQQPLLVPPPQQPVLPWLAVPLGQVDPPDPKH
jgi:hypothetical protein